MAEVMSPNPFDPQPVDPESQAVLTDFIDYTEHLPADLIRSMTLVDDLDKKANKYVQRVDHLLRAYGNLPNLPPDQKPDPLTLRREISFALDKAIKARDAAHAETARVKENVQVHQTRLKLIKAKLQALPKPPSRDPTPPPILQSPVRSKKMELPILPRLKLNVTEKKRKGTTLLDLMGGDEDSPKRTPKLKFIPKTPRSRGNIFGSNAHSTVAGISTSNALAKLAQPPITAQAGTYWRPWFKLTEYEMAKLRKQMKKNAVWEPSDAMIMRELLRDERGLENYHRARDIARSNSMEFVDEEPSNGSRSILLPGEVSRHPNIIRLDSVGNLELDGEQIDLLEQVSKLQTESSGTSQSIELDSPEMMVSIQVESDDKPRTRRETQKNLQAAATERMQDMLGNLKNLFPTPNKDLNSRQAPRSTRKRKRGNEVEDVEVISLTQPPQSPQQKPKKQKIAGNPANGVQIITSTTKIPLAPEDPITPKDSVSISPADMKKLEATAAMSRPRRTSYLVSPVNAPVMSNHIPPRISYNDAADALTATPATTKKLEKSSFIPVTSIIDKNISTAASSKPSRHTRGNRARSVEPEIPKRQDNLRRLSVHLESENSKQKAQEKLEAMSIESGRKTRGGFRKVNGPVTMMSSETGSNKIGLGKQFKKPSKDAIISKKGSNKNRQQEQDEDEDEDEDADGDDESDGPYCICGQGSYGVMLCCDNQKCPKRWYHLECLGLKKLPPYVSKRKWFCQECQESLGVDTNGKPNEPTTTASGRRIQKAT